MPKPHPLIKQRINRNKSELTVSKISIQEEFTTSEKIGPSWTFSSSTRLESLLQKTNLGLRPLEPHPPQKNSVAAQVLPLGGRRRKRKKNNLREYFPFVEQQQSERKKRKKLLGGEDCFGGLPDEMILRIFSYTHAPTLSTLSLVSHRFHRLSNDESLWEKIDCIGATLSSTQLSTIFNRKPSYLRIARSEIISTNLVVTLPIIYLDLTMTLVETDILEQILKNCPKLTHCSLEHLRVNNGCLKALENCGNLEVLNLSMCYELGVGGLGELFSITKGLKALNLACVVQDWNENELMELIGKLPRNLEQLNFSGFRYLLRDGHIKCLSSRLTQLIDLDLSDSQELTGKTLEHLIHLKKLQHLSLSRCYAVEPGAYSHLTALTSLRYLELFSLFKEASIKSLASTLLHGIEINQFPFSSVARPTVGNKRSSIWGKRLKN